jgi:hypothetical protein
MFSTSEDFTGRYPFSGKPSKSVEVKIVTALKYNADCDLCSQPVEIQGFFLDTREGRKVFCCPGCQSIFQLLERINNTPSEPSSSATTTKITKNEGK